MEYFHEKFKNIIKNKQNRKNIYEHLKKKCKNETEMYLKFYELYCEFTSFPNKEYLLQQLKNDNFLYNHQDFADIRDIVREEEEFITKPPELSEGILSCKFCMSRKTLSYEKQTRSSDEQSTIFVKCLECNKSFRM